MLLRQLLRALAGASAPPSSANLQRRPLLRPVAPPPASDPIIHPLLDDDAGLRSPRMHDRHEAGLWTSTQLQGLPAGGADPQRVRPEELRDAWAQFMAMGKGEQIALIAKEMEGIDHAEYREIERTLRDRLDQIWLPAPGPQYQAYISQADIVFYGGAGSGGKSDLLLGLALTQHQRSLIMRRSYAEMHALLARAIQINRGRNGYNGSPPMRLRRPDGRLIEFGACLLPEDVRAWMGQPHDLVALDEASAWLEWMVRFLFGWLRTTDPDQRCRMVLASNPPMSDEGQWLVRWFAPWLDENHPNPAAPGELRWFLFSEDGEASEDREVPHRGPWGTTPAGRPIYAHSRTYIPAKASDNPYVNLEDYERQMQNMAEPERSAIRDGNFLVARKDDAKQVIPSEWIRIAQRRWEEGPPRGKRMTVCAADASGEGRDPSVIACRYENWFAPLVVPPKYLDIRQGRVLAGHIFEALRDRCEVVIDMGGGYGGEAFAHLEEMGLMVRGFVGSGAGIGHMRNVPGVTFANRRAQVIWQFREALDPASGDNIALPPDDALAADLGSYRRNIEHQLKRGVILIEEKSDIKKRLGRSPDRGDAVVMCWAYGGMVLEHRAEHPRRPRTAHVVNAKVKGYVDAPSNRQRFANTGRKPRW